MSLTDVVAVTRLLAEAQTRLTVEERVVLHNATQQALRAMIADITTDPAATPELAPTATVRANDYNPNAVARTELALLEESIRADGITMPIVVVRSHEGDGYVVVDGFHRSLMGRKLARSYLPVSVIDRPLGDRMASTVRHNRARGKHSVDLMSGLLEGMVRLGWDDERIATALGMSVEEVLRLRQMAGAALAMAAPAYSRPWGPLPDSGKGEP